MVVRASVACVSGLIALSAIAGCGGGDACDADAIAAALRGAAAGDTVDVGACAVTRSLRVPAGVTLAGAGTDRTLLAPSGSVTVFLEPGASVRDLTVEASSVAGIAALAEGGACPSPRAGAIGIERVDVVATRGYGIYAHCVETVTLTGVDLSGPFIDAVVDDPLFSEVAPEADRVPATCETAPAGLCTPGEERSVTPEACPECATFRQRCNGCQRWVTLTATQGLVLRSVGAATITGLDVEGFVEEGVSIVDVPAVQISGGRVERNRGIGLFAARSTVELRGLTIARTLESDFGSTFATGVFVDGGRLVTSDVTLTDNFFGIVQTGGSAAHTNLTATGNDDAALWLGDCDGVVVDGGMLADNAFAGVVVSRCRDVTVRGITVTGTSVKTSMRVSGLPGGRVDAGDGLHLRETFEAVRVDGVMLRDNARAGLLLDLGPVGGATDIVFSGVTVSASGSALGAVAGPTTGSSLTAIAPGSWDGGITREGAAVENDAAAVDRLFEIVGVPVPAGVPLEPLEAVGVTTPDR